MDEFNSHVKAKTFSCTECDDYELTKRYAGVEGTPGEAEYEQIEAPDACPVCGGDITERGV